MRCNPEAVVTKTNANPRGAADKTPEARRKGSDRLEKLLESSFPAAAREFAETVVDQIREAL
jgi:hypothetical protein